MVLAQLSRKNATIFSSPQPEIGRLEIGKIAFRQLPQRAHHDVRSDEKAISPPNCSEIVAKSLKLLRISAKLRRNHRNCGEIVEIVAKSSKLWRKL
jgi:hypothetical protein